MTAVFPIRLQKPQAAFKSNHLVILHFLQTSDILPSFPFIFFLVNSVQKPIVKEQNLPPLLAHHFNIKDIIIRWYNDYCGLNKIE